MQYESSSLSTVSIGIFSTEAKLDAYAAEHDPTLKSRSTPHIHREDDFFFVHFVKMSHPLDNPAPRSTGGGGEPIYGKNYEAIKAEFVEKRKIAAIERAERFAGYRAAGMM